MHITKLTKVVTYCILLLTPLETAIKANTVVVLGEITTSAKVDYVQIVKNTLKMIGYEDEENGMIILCN